MLSHYDANGVDVDAKVLVNEDALLGAAAHNATASARADAEIGCLSRPATSLVRVGVYRRPAYKAIRRHPVSWNGSARRIERGEGRLATAERGSRSR